MTSPLVCRSTRCLQALQPLGRCAHRTVDLLCDLLSCSVWSLRQHGRDHLLFALEALRVNRRRCCGLLAICAENRCWIIQGFFLLTRRCLYLARLCLGVRLCRCGELLDGSRLLADGHLPG